MGGIFASSLRRLKFLAGVAALFGFITFITSLTIFDWACTLDREIDCANDEDQYFADCHGRQTWKQVAVFAISASVYEMISSMFFFQSRLGMRSWIIGNTLIGVFSLFFAYFIAKLWPTLMAVYLCNFVVLSVCSILVVKNMTSFEETSMTLLT